MHKLKNNLINTSWNQVDAITIKGATSVSSESSLRITMYTWPSCIDLLNTKTHVRYKLLSIKI